MVSDHRIGIDPSLLQWQPMLRLATLSAVSVACLIPVQAAVFLLSPPPVTVLEYFELFQRNPALGLLDLDLLLSLDYLVMIPLYLALFLLVRTRAATAAALGLVLGLFSVVLFLVSREATFSMWLLSAQHAGTVDPVQRAALIASGQLLLTLYGGGSFALSYLLGAGSTLFFSVPMFRHRILGGAPGLIGIITGVTMVIPANLGTVGLVAALLSLIPTLTWLILLARGLRGVHRDLSAVGEAEKGTPPGRAEGPQHTDDGASSLSDGGRPYR